MVATSGEKVVVIPYSMGVLYFFHFMKWAEAPAPIDGILLYKQNQLSSKCFSQPLQGQKPILSSRYMLFIT